MVYDLLSVMFVVCVISALETAMMNYAMHLVVQIYI